jgi:hypothetical protein
MPKISKILTDGPIVVNVFKLLKADESIRWGQDISLKLNQQENFLRPLTKELLPPFEKGGKEDFRTMSLLL